MRDYSKVSGSFWTGKTGKALRGDMQTQIVAMYLMTSPHANMIGVFHCPIIYIAHETGSSIEGATKGLDKLCEGGFCTYVHDTETVWVHEMAKFQIDDALKPGDKRVLGIQKIYDSMPESIIKIGFYRKYNTAFHLPNSFKTSKPLTSPLQAPPKPEAGTEAEAEDKTSSATDVAGDDGKEIYSAAFLTFWEIYPNRVNKGAAFKVFKKIKAAEYPAIRSGLERKKQSPAWLKDNGKFIPHAASWLNARGWEDEDAPAATPAKPTYRAKTQAEMDAEQEQHRVVMEERKRKILAMPIEPNPWEVNHVKT